MVLGFKKRFEQPILTGSKIHTVRQDEKDRWHRGMTIHFATGTRTKNYNCFKVSEVIYTQRIFMSYDWMLHISIDGRELFGYNEREQFAINDGFSSLEDFENWWYPILEKDEDHTFSGKVIHWTNYQYKKAW